MTTMNARKFAPMNDAGWESAGEGVRRKIGPYDDTMSAVYVEFGKGAIGYLHTHPHHQITYIQSGSFEVKIGTETQTLGGGDFYYVPENVTHGVVALEKGVLVDFFAPCRTDLVKGK